MAARMDMGLRRFRIGSSEPFTICCAAQSALRTLGTHACDEVVGLTPREVQRLEPKVKGSRNTIRSATKVGSEPRIASDEPLAKFIERGEFSLCSRGR